MTAPDIDAQIAAVERANQQWTAFHGKYQATESARKVFADQTKALTAALDTLRAVPGLVAAAQKAEDVFALVERPNILDPDHWREVKALGDRIGYGALMSSASASWRLAILSQGFAGGEFVAGPCHATVLSTLKLIRAVLARFPSLADKEPRT